MEINLAFKALIKPDILKSSLSLINALLKTLWFSLTIPNIGLQVLLQTPYHAENLLDNMYLLGIKILFLQHESFIYSYKKSQQGALFLKFILVKNLFRTDLLSIIRNLNSVFTATGICQTSYVECLLGRSSWNTS